MQFETQVVRSRRGAIRHYQLAALDCEARAYATAQGWPNPVRLPFASCADPAAVLRHADAMTHGHCGPLIAGVGNAYLGDCGCGGCERLHRARTAGQLDYERDVVRRPLYHDGGARPAWESLGEIEQWSWERGAGRTAALA